MQDSDISDPYVVNNSYTPLTIGNVKNFEVANKTKNCIAKVYTQNLQLKHEDRFLFSLTTLSSLANIKAKHPKDRFTSQIIIPPSETLLLGYERLLENTLAQISNAFDIIVFGGMVAVEATPEDESVLPYAGQGECIDLPFVQGNMGDKTKPAVVSISQFGTTQFNYYNQTHNDFAKLKRSFFNVNGNLILSSQVLLDEINNVDDDTRVVYPMSYVCRCVFLLLNKSRARRVELRVKYAMNLLDEDYLGFSTMCAKHNITLEVSKNKMIVLVQ